MGRNVLMKYNLKGLMVIQNNLLSWKGSEVNRNYWSRILADHFPNIIKDKDGLPTVIEFLGRKFYSRSVKKVAHSIDTEKLEEIKTLLAETKRLQEQDEWMKADEVYFQIIDRGLLDWMIEEIESYSNRSIH